MLTCLQRVLPDGRVGVLYPVLTCPQLVSAIHSSSQVRYVPLLQQPGFLIMAADAHTSLGWSTETFTELSKLAMRAGLGVYVCLDPVKWKG